jgi:CDGSH-type Zn-finger protein
MMQGADLQAAIEALRRDMNRLLSLEDIRGVITAYARACDRGNDPVALRPLFTDDASWECKGFGRYEGGDRVCAALKAIASATAFWYLWEAATLPHESTGQAEACMIGATYEARLVRDEASWRFSSVELILNMASPLHEGWVSKRFPAGNARQPYFLQLQPGAYAWCACGKSQTQPFCDGSHAGSATTPVAFTLDTPGNVVICGCRYSRRKPFCDGAHLNLKLPA